MITALHLEGLKAFARPQRIPVAPITLIFGANSAGKSSLVQSLLLLKQTVEESPDGRLISDGRLVDLGRFRNLVHGHDTSRTLELGLEVSERTPTATGAAPPSLTFTGQFTFAARTADEASLMSLALDWSPDVSERPSRRKARPPMLRLIPRHERAGTWNHGPEVLRYRVAPNEWPSAPMTQWLSAVLDRTQKTPTGWADVRHLVDRARAGLPTQADELDDTLAQAVSQTALTFQSEGGWSGAEAWLPTNATPQAGESPSAHPVAEALTQALQRTVAAITSTLNGITYLGPLRDSPPRVLAMQPRGAGHIGVRGQDAAVALARDPGLRETVNQHLERLDITYRLETNPLAEGDALTDDLVALRFVDHRYQPPLPVNVRDVGFGMSQVLPIVTASAARPGDTVVVEQPELHIHPALQANLAEVFLSGSASTQFIIETHSEHLLLRLLRHVRLGSLAPDQLSVLYVSHRPGGAGSEVLRIEIDDDGEFVGGWPGGFFTEREHELWDDDPDRKTESG